MTEPRQTPDPRELADEHDEPGTAAGRRLWAFLRDRWPEAGLITPHDIIKAEKQAAAAAESRVRDLREALEAAAYGLERLGYAADAVNIRAVLKLDGRAAEPTPERDPSAAEWDSLTESGSEPDRPATARALVEALLPDDWRYQAQPCGERAGAIGNSAWQAWAWHGPSDSRIVNGWGGSESAALLDLASKLGATAEEDRNG